MIKQRYHFPLPPTCPFTITNLCNGEGESCPAWMIREDDVYGQRPHIYAKICSSNGPDGKAEVIVLSDTGCGTEVTADQEIGNSQSPDNSSVWNIRTLLEYTINPGGKLHYLVIMTHCHWDHILGIAKFLSSPTTIASSSQEKIKCEPSSVQIVASAKGIQFAYPYCKVQKNSHCLALGLEAPQYNITTWAFDFAPINYVRADKSQFSTNITILHTQGHTPDSLSWYDGDLRHLHVGGSFHVNDAETDEPAATGLGKKAHTTFCLDSDLAAWWGQMGKILGFVQQKNQEIADSSLSQKATGQLYTASNRLKCGTNPETVKCQITPREDWTVLSKDELNKFTVNQPQTGDGEVFPYGTSNIHLGVDAKSWVHINRRCSRVRLMTGCTLPKIDAEEAIVQMKEFVAAILRDEVPSKRIENGPDDEERWLWDNALEGMTCPYSIVAPKVVIDRGRRTISRSQWTDLKDS